MTINPRHNARDIFPPTGTEKTAKTWQTEAALRMLMNNLHPDVAENPHELVELIVSLRPTFEKTITLLEGEASPLMTRRPAFGRRADQRGGFGRAG